MPKNEGDIGDVEGGGSSDPFKELSKHFLGLTDPHRADFFRGILGGGYSEDLNLMTNSCEGQKLKKRGAERERTGGS